MKIVALALTAILVAPAAHAGPRFDRSSRYDLCEVGPRASCSSLATSSRTGALRLEMFAQSPIGGVIPGFARSYVIAGVSEDSLVVRSARRSVRVRAVIDYTRVRRSLVLAGPVPAAPAQAVASLEMIVFHATCADCYTTKVIRVMDDGLTPPPRATYTLDVKPGPGSRVPAGSIRVTALLKGDVNVGQDLFRMAGVGSASAELRAVVRSISLV